MYVSILHPACPTISISRYPDPFIIPRKYDWDNAMNWSTDFVLILQAFPQMSFFSNSRIQSRIPHCISYLLIITILTFLNEEIQIYFSISSLTWHVNIITYFYENSYIFWNIPKKPLGKCIVSHFGKSLSCSIQQKTIVFSYLILHSSVCCDIPCPVACGKCHCSLVRKREWKRQITP